MTDDNEAPAAAPAPPRTRALKRALRRTVRRIRRRRAARNKGRKLQAKILFLTLLGLAGTFAWSLDFLAPDPVGGKLTFDQLGGLADEKRIVSATFLDHDAMVVGEFRCARPILPNARSEKAAVCDATTIAAAPTERVIHPKDVEKRPKNRRVIEQTTATARYWLSYPSSDLATGTLLQLVTKAGATVQIDPQTTKGNVRLVATFLLPLVILANLFALLFSLSRQGGSGIGEVIVFGSLARKRIRRGRRTNPVTFADVGGADEAVTELAEVVDYLRAPERYEDIGAQPPKGILMVGPPGCGKTLLAKAAAGEARVPFFSVAGAEFVESLVGVGAARVRDLFRRVRAVAPAIVFIDELDAAGRRRGAGGGTGGTDEREQTLNQLLVEMDGFDASSGIVVIGATNRPDILDPALLRPGRFDRHITVDQPDREGRRAIIELHARGRRFAPSVDLDALARRTPGFSGADLANVVNEAALLAVRAGKPDVETAELFEAVERVMAGPQRRSRVLSAPERHRAAVHEAGHVIAASAAGDEIHRVSILSRGRSVAATVAREQDGALLTRSDLQRRLVAMMAGVAAEELVLGEPSTGGERDIEGATLLARDIVARYGMSGRLGRARLLGRDSEAFLEGEVPFAELSPETQRAIDEEVERLLAEAERAGRALVADNRAALDTIVARLEVEETIEGGELGDVLATIDGRRIVLPEQLEPRQRRRSKT